MSNKLLSVSVAAYNAQDYLREVLDSFTCIKNKDLVEVFVVDDGGIDASLEIAQEYEGKYPGVFRAIHKSNGGWGSTVNYSIQNASGKFFRLLDGDDYFSSENLDAFIDYLKIIESDIVMTPFVSFYDDDYKRQELYGPGNDVEFQKLYRLEEVQGRMILSMHGITVKTQLLKESNIKIKEKVLYRDMEFTAYALTIGQTVSFFELPVYYYRLGREGQSVSKNAYIKHSAEHESIVYDILSISEKQCNQQKKSVFYDLARGACLQQYAIFFYTENNNMTRRKVMSFDNRIKKYPEFYNSIPLPMYIKILRKTSFMGYEFVMKLLPVWRKIKTEIRK